MRGESAIAVAGRVARLRQAEILAARAIVRRGIARGELHRGTSVTLLLDAVVDGCLNHALAAPGRRRPDRLRGPAGARPASTISQPDLSGLSIDVVAGGEVPPRSPPFGCDRGPRPAPAAVRRTSRPSFPLPAGRGGVDAGDEHEFSFRIRVDELPAPFYCCTPQFSCESFDLNVRFDRRRPPQRVRRIDGEFSKDALP